MEFIEHFESSLTVVVRLMKLVLETISVLCVLAGLVAVTAKIIERRGLTHSFPFLELRLKFGTWLALALEFQLGSDILATTISPSLEALGQLALIALIRTFLNYFLSKELTAEESISKKRLIDKSDY